MKLIFLDIDGVLVTPTTHTNYLKLKQEADVNGKLYYDKPMFDKNAIENLNTLAKKTGEKIVITSQWRRTQSVEFIKSTIASAGFLFWYQILKTEYWFCREDQWRSDEIEDFLVDFSMRGNGDIVVPNYVIIDNSEDYQDYQLPYLVQTDPEKGFSSEDLEKAIKILEGVK